MIQLIQDRINLHKAPELSKICQDQEICPASDDLYAGPQDKMKHEISNAVFMFP